jgi:hypothetical protein
MKIIYTSKAEEIVIDDEDYDYLNQFSWRINRDGYAITCKVGEKADVYMHRLLLGATNFSTKVDHINKNRADNRKENLRICTNVQNSYNARKTSSPTTSKYKGVSFDKSRSKWVAYIRADRKSRFLGRFNTEKEAYDARVIASLHLHGDFASL